MDSTLKQRLSNLESLLAKEALKKKASDKLNSGFDPEKFLNSGPLYENLEFDLTDSPPKTKAIAYYLPQFYSFKENDNWWGKGFTEWRNVTRARPRFDNHYQPRLPKDLGFYDLSKSETMLLQAELARKAGIHGWCFYYYRFGNKRLLDLPVNNFLSNKKININFSLMWANENWSRTWTAQGDKNGILMKQDYNPKFDIETIDDLALHFKDERYIHLNGKPLFHIYNPASIPNCKKRIEAWRELLWSRHSIEAHFHMAQVYGQRDPRKFGLDGAIEFPPHNITQTQHSISSSLLGTNEKFSSRIFNYDDIIRRSVSLKKPEYDLIKCIVPDWDNDARKPNQGFGYHGSTPQKYQKWLELTIDYAKQHTVHNESIIAINAWNEWAESAYLEPDIYYGSAYLNATARALINN